MQTKLNQFLGLGDQVVEVEESNLESERAQ
jgi:hypothetical protein